MGTAHHRRQLIVCPFSPAKDIAHFINVNLKINLPQPFDEQIPGLFVFIGQSQTLDSAIGGLHRFLPFPKACLATAWHSLLILLFPLIFKPFYTVYEKKLSN